MMDFPKQKLTTFLSFSGNAEDAMRYYESIIPDAKIESIARFELGQPNGDAGKVLSGVLDFAGQKVMFMDMPAANPAPSFAWSVSLLFLCADENEFDAVFTGFSAGGVIMMGPEPVMDIRKCAWVTDKFGVTWQLVW